MKPFVSTLVVARTLVVAVGLGCIAAPVLAADMSQQDKMKMCNQDAAGKKGDDRKAFMSQCLSAKKMSQQDRMKVCNKDAAGKKGDDRKAFMSDCLSNKS